MKKRIVIPLLLLSMIFILSCIYGGVTPSFIGSDRLGRVWYEHEAGWNGVWTRRGYSNVFDATWTKGGTGGTAVLIIDIRGNFVKIERRGNDGTVIHYTGYLSPDGTRASGTVQPSDGVTWDATITR